MARFSSLLAVLAASGLAVAQPAAAAVRTGSPIGQSEAIVEGPGAYAVLGLIALFGVVFLIMAITDDYDPDNDGRPTSP